MTIRTRWLNLAISLGIILSLGLVSISTVAAAKAGKSHSSKSSIPVRCKSRVKSSGTVKYSDWQFPSTLNTYQENSVVSVETTSSMFVGLWRYNDQAHFSTLMATTLPTVKNGGITNGGKTITIHLKKGMLWSTGQEMTSADIKFGWKVDSDKLTGPTCLGSCDVIASIATPDKYTAVFHLKKVYAPFLAYGIPDIWPSKVAGAWNNDPHAAAVKLEDPTYSFESSSYPTNGPYQVKSFVKDDRIVLGPMNKYNVTGCGAYVKNLIFAFYSDKPGLIAAAASKQTDVTTDYSLGDLPELRKHTDAYTLHADPAFTIEHLEYNVDPQYNGAANPTSNLKVRLALALALDKVGLIQSALGITRKTALQSVAWTPLINTPSIKQPFADKKLTGQWDPLQKKYVATGSGKALADAKKLLSQTPYKGGFNLDVDTTSGNPVRAAQMAVIVANWARLGVHVNQNFIPASRFFSDYAHNSELNTGKFQVAMFAFSGSPDPDQLKFNVESQYIDREHTTHTATYVNYSGIKNKTLDNAFNAAAHTLDNSLRQKYYNVAQVLMNQQAYWIPLFYRPEIATSDSALANFKNNPTQAGVTWNTFDWKAKAS